MDFEDWENFRFYKFAICIPHISGIDVEFMDTRNFISKDECIKCSKESRECTDHTKFFVLMECVVKSILRSLKLNKIFYSIK